MESKKTVRIDDAPLSERAPAPKRARPERFTLVRRLGEGTMGVVYEAIDRESGRSVALKTLTHASPSALYHLKNEFRALTDVVHPNLVTLHELIVDDSTQLFTMELVQGVPFDDYVRVGFYERGSYEPPAPGAKARTTVRELDATPQSEAETEPKLDLCRLVRALIQLASGIEALHRAGKLHRDLKPSNVLVSAAGDVKILDFGLVSDSRTEPVGQTMGGKIAGTPVYMSPEQAAGDWATPASDWYAFGVMLYEVLTGRVPFDGPIYDVLAIKQREVPKPPSRFCAVGSIPSALDTLCMALLSIEAGERPTGAAVLSTLRALQPDEPSPSSRPPLTALGSGIVSGIRPTQALVGRRDELRVLQETLRATGQGTPWVVRVTGPSGIGKSALLSSFADRVGADERSVVLRGRCYERESVPYKGIDGLIDSLSRHLRRLRPRDVLPLLPRNLHCLCRVFPVLARVDSIMTSTPRSADLPLDPAEQRRLAWGALRDLLGRVADSRPLLLCIDDFQWADRDSAQLLSALLAPPDPPPLMLLLACREDDAGTTPALSALLDELQTHRVRERHVQLAGLRTEDVSELISTCLPEGTRLDAGACVRESEGNPFLVHELLRQAERHVLDGAPHERLDLDAAVLTRMAALPADARGVLQVVALAARPTRFDVLAHATSAVDVRAAVRKLQAEGLVRTSAKDPNLVEACHDRLRAAVVRSFDEAQLCALHTRLADALLANEGDPETLVEHLIGAGDVEQALQQALRAASRAERALSFDRAARFYRRAIDLAARACPGELPILELLLAEALVAAGRCLEGADAYDRAAERSRGDASSRLRLRAASQLLLAGRADAGLQRLDRALATYGVPTFRDEQHSVEHIGRTLTAYAALCERLEPSISWRSEHELSDEERTRLDVIHCAAIGLAWLDMGSRYFALALEDAKGSLESREPLRVVSSGSLLGSLFESLGSPLPPAAASLIAQARALTDAPHARAWSDYALGATAYFQSRFHDACEALGRAEETFRSRCQGASREATIVRIPLLISLRWSGHLGDVIRGCEQWAASARAQGDVFTELWMQLLDISLSCADEPAQARWRVEDSIAKLGMFVSRAASPSSAAVVRLIGQVRRAEVDWYDGDDTGAYEHVRVLWSERRGDSATLVNDGEASMRLPLHSMQLVWHRVRAFCGMLAVRGHLDAELEAELRELLAQHDAFTIPTMTSPAMLHAAVALASGDHVRAASLLQDEARYAKQVHRCLERAACLELQAARLIGGTEGRVAYEAAHGYLRSIGIRNPERWARVIAPGF